MKRILLRGQPWVVRDQVSLGERTRFRLEDADSGEAIEALCPPDEFEPLIEPAPSLDRRSLTPYGIWRSLHDALRLQCPSDGHYAAFHAGRISPEPYQFAPLARLLSGPRRSLLIADDVGLGKTVEAGICLLELIARGIGKRILLVVPPGLIPQWLDEMWEKFGLAFQPIENSASLDRAPITANGWSRVWRQISRSVSDAGSAAAIYSVCVPSILPTAIYCRHRPQNPSHGREKTADIVCTIRITGDSPDAVWRIYRRFCFRRSEQGNRNSPDFRIIGSEISRSV